MRSPHAVGSGASRRPSQYAGSLFEPDVILPAQLLTPRAQAGPERRLILAVLTDAIECYQKYRGARSQSGRRLFREAEQWLMAEQRGWAFSFCNICDVLGIDAAYVRRGLVQWQQRDDAAPPRHREHERPPLTADRAEWPWPVAGCPPV